MSNVSWEWAWRSQRVWNGKDDSHQRRKMNIWSTEWRNMIAFQSQPTSNSCGSTASSQSETNSQVICQKLCIIQKPPSSRTFKIWKTSLNGSNTGYFPLKYLKHAKRTATSILRLGLSLILTHTGIYIHNLVISYFDLKNKTCSVPYFTHKPMLGQCKMLNKLNHWIR